MFRKPRRLACAVSELPVSAPRAFCGNETQTSPNLTMHRHHTPAQCDLEKSICGRTFVFRTRVSVGEPQPHTKLTPLQMIADSPKLNLRTFSKTHWGWLEAARKISFAQIPKSPVWWFSSGLSIICISQTKRMLKLLEIEMWNSNHV